MWPFSWFQKRKEEKRREALAREASLRLRHGSVPPMVGRVSRQPVVMGSGPVNDGGIDLVDAMIINEVVQDAAPVIGAVAQAAGSAFESVIEAVGEATESVCEAVGSAVESVFED